MSGDTHESGTSSTVDRYLETIYCVAGEGEVVRPSRLAQWLGVSAPTVSDAVQRLERDGWVTIARDRSVQLTSKGHAKASSIVRRHRILERWLTDTLGFDWAAADEEADRLSSVISDDVIERIDESMGSPLTCPHGNPIPGRTPAYGRLTTLADLEPGTEAVVRRISEVAEHEARALLLSLHEIGVHEGSHVMVSAHVSLDAHLMVEIDQRTLSLPSDSAKWIWVETAEVTMNDESTVTVSK
ncbi:MAG: metal-dependent transcriptional regulator [Acidimicrobiales bacterium]